MQRPEYVTPIEEGVFRLSLWIQAGSSKSLVAGPYGGLLKLRVRSPASGNRANKEALKLLARLLGVKQSQLHMESGQTGRRKSIVISVNKEPDWGRLIRN